jgi:hypothetical protein
LKLSRYESFANALLGAESDDSTGLIEVDDPQVAITRDGTYVVGELADGADVAGEFEDGADVACELADEAADPVVKQDEVDDGCPDVGEDQTAVLISLLARPSTPDFNSEVHSRPMEPDCRQCHHDRRRHHPGTCGRRCGNCEKQAKAGRDDGGEADDDEDEEGIAPYYMNGSCGRPVGDVRGEDLSSGGAGSSSEVVVGDTNPILHDLVERFPGDTFPDTSPTFDVVAVTSSKSVRSRSRSRSSPCLGGAHALEAHALGQAWKQAVAGISMRMHPWGPEASYSDVLEHVTRIVRTVASEGGNFYIGITENPARRFEQHSANWRNMIVIHSAPSSSETSSLEKSLIERFKLNLMCHNVGAGGEHASAGSPHFLYVLKNLPWGAGQLYRSNFRGSTKQNRLPKLSDDLFRGFSAY